MIETNGYFILTSRLALVMVVAQAIMQQPVANYELTILALLMTDPTFTSLSLITRYLTHLMYFLADGIAQTPMKMPVMVLEFTILLEI